MNQYKCADGLQCISAYDFCDGRVDCNDGSDELIEMCKGKIIYTYVKKHGYIKID